jgi:hypothetical protein
LTFCQLRLGLFSLVLRSTGSPHCLQTIRCNQSMGDLYTKKR